MPIDNQPIAGKNPGIDTGAPAQVTPPVPLKKPKKDELKLEKPAKGKKLNDIVKIRPKLQEAKEKHAVMTFGRMNPPTTGHEKLIHKTHSVAQKVGAKAHIVLSHSHDKKNNPLPQKHKINYVKKIHNGVHVTGSSKQHPNFLSHAKKLHQAGHDHLHVVAGSDRVGEYKKVLNKYNGHKDHYNFKSITVHSAGQRDPDSEGTSGISGTKMRAHARAGDHKSFKAGLPKALHGHHKKIMGHIKESIEEFEWEEMLTEELLDQLVEETYTEEEELINERVLTLMQRRKAALKMRRLRFRIARARKLKKKRMASTDMLVRRARRAARTFIRKRIAGKQGANYAQLSPSQKIVIDKRVEKKAMFINKLARRLLPKVKQAELRRLKSARTKKESINLDFSNYLTELQNGGKTSVGEVEQQENNFVSSTETSSEAADPRVERLSDKHKNEKENTDKRHKIEREKLKVQMAKSKQAELRREAIDVAEAVDVMVDALAALDKKAQQANVDLDTLFIQFIEGYFNPHGQQTPQQGGFANVNKMLAEMSQAEKDKAEDIVKGMKKNLSSFKRRYGKDYKSVMYATANKMAQEQVNESLKDWFGKGKKGDWVRVGVDGEIKGDCARDEGEGKPKCMPRSKAHSMKKKDRASAARRKRAADPVADRPGKGGKPVMVKTQKESVKPSGKATKPYSSHGIPKDATKAELKAIRSNPKSSKGKKQLAHWKLNMHEDYGAMKDAQAHAKKDGANYDRDVSVQHKYDAYHMKKRGYTHRKYNAYGSYEYNKHGSGNKITSADHHGVSEGKSAYDRINDRFKKLSGGQSLEDRAAYYKKEKEKGEKKLAQFRKDNNYNSKTGQYEEFVLEANKPNNPKLWAAKKAAAKAKFDVYPSAYANGWAVQQYNKAGGTWRKTNESLDEVMMTGLAAKAAGAVAGHVAKAAAAKAAPYVAGAAAAYGAKKYAQHKIKKKRDQEMLNKAASQAVAQYKQDHENVQENKDKSDKTKKLTQLFRMGLAKKGELHTMLRMIKRDEDALKDPKLRSKMYELLDKLTDIVTKDGQIFVKVRQAVQKDRDDLQAVEEMLQLEGAVLGINKAFEMLNINEDMSGMSVSSGHKRSVAQGAGMTKKGVAAYRRRNPGSKLKTAVTTPPSKLKPGSKAANRRKAFCSRSRSWTSDRGKAARRRWNC